MQTFIIVIVALILIVIGPIATIWGMNTLFPSLAIPYNLDTWVAVVVLKGFAVATISKK